MDTLPPPQPPALTRPAPSHMPLAMLALSPQQRRRLNFIRAERLSASEAGDIPYDFDPGLEYEPCA